MPWRATGDDSAGGLNRYPEPQPQALVERWPRSTACRATSCWSAAAATRPSTCWCAPSAAPARTGRRSLRRPSACTRSPRGSRARRCVEVPLRAAGFRPRRRRRSSQAGQRRRSSCSCARPTIRPATLLDDGAVIERLPRARSGRALVVRRRGLRRVRRRASLRDAGSREFPNLVVLRTLSKAHALAGARCGALIAADAIVRLLQAHHAAVRAARADRRGRRLRCAERRSGAHGAARIAHARSASASACARALAASAGRRAGLADATPTSCWCEFAMPQARLERRPRRRLLRARLLRAQPRLAGLPAHHRRHARAERAAARPRWRPHERRHAILFVDRDGTLIEEPRRRAGRQPARSCASCRA